MPTYNSWMTSSDLINSVKRKISLPTFQNSTSDQDILDFASEELLISQVPSILSVHEEYYVYTQDVALVPQKTKYPIPERAIGIKLRDVFF